MMSLNFDKEASRSKNVKVAWMSTIVTQSDG